MRDLKKTKQKHLKKKKIQNGCQWRPIQYVDSRVELGDRDMSGLETASGGGENARTTPCPPEDIKTLPEKVEVMMKLMDFLQKEIDKELRLAKQNCRREPRGTHFFIVRPTYSLYNYFLNMPCSW